MDILLSVIIVNYNDDCLIPDCVDSINKYNDLGDGLEIIVVDNSDDNKYADSLAAKLKGKKYVSYYKNNNLGFGQGNNMGSKIAKGRYLLFLNPDTLLIEPVFKFAINQFEKDHELAWFGIKLLAKNKKENVSFFFRDLTGIMSSVLSKIMNKLNIFIPSMMVTCGADMFFRKESFESVKGFDENIFMYHEEADISRRIDQKNLKRKYYSSKHIIHLEGNSRNDNENAEKMVMRGVETENYYCNKYGLNLIVRLKGRRSSWRFKEIWYRIILDKNSASKCKKMNALYKSLINKYVDKYDV